MNIVGSPYESSLTRRSLHFDHFKLQMVKLSHTQRHCNVSCESQLELMHACVSLRCSPGLDNRPAGEAHFPFA